MSGSLLCQCVCIHSAVFTHIYVHEVKFKFMSNYLSMIAGKQTGIGSRLFVFLFELLEFDRISRVDSAELRVL